MKMLHLWQSVYVFITMLVDTDTQYYGFFVLFFNRTLKVSVWVIGDLIENTY